MTGSTRHGRGRRDPQHAAHEVSRKVSRPPTVQLGAAKPVLRSREPGKNKLKKYIFLTIISFLFYLQVILESRSERAAVRVRFLKGSAVKKKKIINISHISIFPHLFPGSFSFLVKRFNHHHEAAEGLSISFLFPLFFLFLYARQPQLCTSCLRLGPSLSEDAE